MAEGFSPRVKAQIAVIPATKCELCETNDIQFKCFTCEEYTYMCNTCKLAHKKTPATRNHKITSTKGADPRDEENVKTGEENKCPSHPTGDLIMYCKACSLPVCADCLASGSHQNHKLAKVLDIIDDTQKELSQIMEDANSKLSTAEDNIKSIKKIGDKFSKDVDECIDQVRARSVQLKSMLDQISNKVIDKLQKRKKQNPDQLKEVEDKANKDISALKEMIDTCKEQQKKRHMQLVRFVTDVRNKLDKLQLSTVPGQPNPPVFVTTEVTIQKLKILFGYLDDEDEKGSDYERSTEVTPTLAKPTIDVKVLSSITMDQKSIVAAVSDTQA